MQPSKYLNTVLTAITLLLGLNLWVGAHQSPTTAALDLTEQAHAQGRVDAGQQRTKMIEALNSLNTKVDAVSKKLSDGSVKVKVDGLGEND